MAVKCIPFSDGSKICLFAKDASIWDDRVTVNPNEVQTYSLTNAFITAGNSSGGFVNENLNGKSLIDGDGNTWVFAKISATRFQVSISKRSGEVVSFPLDRSYTGTFYYFHALVCTEKTSDGKYGIALDSLYPSISSIRQVSGSVKYLRMGYQDGVSGNYNFVDDVAMINPAEGFTNCQLRNIITGGSPFVTVTGLASGYTTTTVRTVTALEYYGSPYSGAALGRPFLYLSENAIKDYVETSPDPYSNIDGMGEISGGGSGYVGIPGFPGLTAASAGVIGLFAPSAAQMQALASYMWTDFGGEGVTAEDILKEVVEALKRSIANPLDYVVGLNIIPSQGLSVGGSSSIRFGFTDSGVTMPRLSNQYFTVNCGSIHFDPVCGDTFLDYAPYSKFAMYLPYIGVKDMDANDFVGHTIGVVYHGDCVTGGVTAYITKDGSVMYQYSGCCALNVPLSADGWGSTIAGAVQIATSLLTAPAGGAAGVASSAALGAASVAANPSLLSPQVSHSGAVSGGAGCMGVQHPFVIRETVRFHSTGGFNTISGYPSYYYKRLGEVEGYTTVVNIHLQGLSATQGEITEIENLLKEGVIL